MDHLYHVLQEGLDEIQYQLHKSRERLEALIEDEENSSPMDIAAVRDEIEYLEDEEKRRKAQLRRASL